MDQMDPKAKQWIEEKKDPRSARWQAGLETLMELFLPNMEKGKLTPVHPLEEMDRPVFKLALARVDLSPGLQAAFLPPSVADPIVPPDSAEELLRIEKGKPSYKIIILRPGKENRLLCAEISEYAHKLGVDIFQSGSLLGSFDYATREICMSELSKAVRAHAWEKKDEWKRKDYISYTMNWFEKTEYLGVSDVAVDTNYSFFHSPTLIKSNRVDSLFLLIYRTLSSRFQDVNGPHKDLSAPGKNETGKKMDLSGCHALAERCTIDLLNLIKDLALIDFATFTNAENQAFKNEFVRTVGKLSSDLSKML